MNHEMLSTFSMRLATRVSGCALALAVSVASVAAAEAPLVQAVKKGDAAAVRTLLQQKANVNAPEVDGTTALHWAANRDDLAMVDQLIRAGANVKAADRYGITPLSLAATNGSAAVIERLLKAGADPNAKQPEGETVLMTAARTGNPAAVKLLLAAGADVKAKENWRGQDALTWAAGEGHVNATKLLLEGGADVNAKSKEGYSALGMAARENHFEVVKALLAAGANPNDTTSAGLTPLSLAIHNANWDVAGYIIEHGANVNANDAGSTPLHLAIQIRNPDVENPNDAGKIVPPGKLTSLDVIKLLVAKGSDVNARMEKPFTGLPGPKETPLAGATPFLLAARGGDATVMRLLHAAGADPMLATKGNTTPLMAAAGVGYSQAISHGTEAEALEACKLAVELGNDVNATNAMGYTALHGAAIRGANSIVQYLVDQGIRIDRRDKQGRTALTIAEMGAGDSTQRRQLHTAELLQKLMTSNR
jgi:ankyrin repeat protein